MKSIPGPSINLTSFSCSHCGTHSHQHWFDVYADPIRSDSKCPSIPDEELKAIFEAAVKTGTAEEREAATSHLTWTKQMLSGVPFLTRIRSGYSADYRVDNAFISQCYTCQKIAVLLHDKMIYPSALDGPKPNSDLPEDVLRDYVEASSIINLSPRGAAALLRLAIEKTPGEFAQSYRGTKRKGTQGRKTRLNRRQDTLARPTRRTCGNRIRGLNASFHSPARVNWR